MLGSLHEAEDLVQETFLRAWRARERFEGKTSFRNWLYRIATNACLNALASRSKSPRILPEAYGPPAGELPLPLIRSTEVLWLEPYPDAELGDVADETPGPEARYEMRESVQLAFVAAIQQLPPRQRAVLLLRDVLGWSANETAGLMDASVASINSALQRARATLEARFPTGEPTHAPAPSTDAQQRALLGRYVQAWEAGDIDGLVALLREDAVLHMPPYPGWFLGREAIRLFFRWGWRENRRFRLVPTAANGQPAFGQYLSRSPGTPFEAHALIVLTLQDDAISKLTIFVGPEIVTRFGLPA